jgi:hypothetical protein
MAKQIIRHLEFYGFPDQNNFMSEPCADSCIDRKQDWEIHKIGHDLYEFRRFQHGFNDKTIEIKCDTKDKIELAEMTELQGTLKERTDIDYDKIKLSIIKYGFSFPFFVWKGEGKNYILDGHGRFATLCKMQKDGYLIQPLPVVYIEAESKAEAKQKLLRLNSQYGKMTKESVLEFASGLDLNFEELALPDSTLDFSNVSEEDAAETEGL